jgi:16S rRNA G1207 methylase RsmC
LNPNGALWLVAYHNKGGETLREIMRGRFGNAEDIVKSGGIRVYKSVKT